MLDREGGILPLLSVYKMRPPLKQECHEDLGKICSFPTKEKNGR